MEGRGEAERTDVHCQRAGAALARGDLAGAADLYRRAIHHGSRNPDAFNNLGVILAQRGDLDGAIPLFEKAAGLAPASADARANLASALGGRGTERYRRGDLDGAIQDLRSSWQLEPTSARTAADLGGVLIRSGRAAEAVEWCRRAMVLDPEHAPAHMNLATALLQLGDLEGGWRHGGEAARLAPGRADYRSGCLLALHYHPTLAPQELAAEHRRFGASFGPTPPARPRARRDRLRVGYLSPDLHRHSVAFFFEPLLRAHDRGAVEITCYADNGDRDAVTARLEGAAEHWAAVAGMPDAALAARLRADGIDVLVDLAGHTDGNRMPLFAGRAAPEQVTYLGYPGTTGLRAMDLRVTDAVADPAGAEALHSEALLRLEGGFLCYAPPLPAGEGPAVAPPPCLERGPVTFGSFNALMKVNVRVLDAWAALLHLVPDARLLLKAPALREEGARQRIWSALEARRVSRSRVTLLPPTTGLGDHLATYAQLDVALDTFPYNGTTTTCEALWMGVPVVTFTGAAHAGRVGASLLAQVGLTELVGGTVEEAVALAAGLARDRERLTELRAGMRARLEASPLLDAPRVARQLERAFAAA